VVGFLLAAVATAWTAIAVDIVIESTLDASHRLVLFARTVATTTSTIEVFVCVALGMSVAAIAAMWIVGSLSRRREVQLRDEVDRRWEEISTFNAGMEARNELLEWRLQDLQEQIETLTARRDELLTDANRDLEDAKEAVRASRSRESLRRLQHGVVVLPEHADEGSPPEAGAGEAPTGTTRHPGNAPDNVRRFPA
jgi:hypothetical protein